jgi:hypothetical protein
MRRITQPQRGGIRQRRSQACAKRADGRELTVVSLDVTSAISIFAMPFWPARHTCQEGLHARKAFHFSTRNTRNAVKHADYQAFRFIQKYKCLIINNYKNLCRSTNHLAQKSNRIRRM